MCGLLFVFFVFSGFLLSSSKSEGRAFPLPGNFDSVWDATLATLHSEKIPLAIVKKEEGYIQSATFPLYKKEYKEWAKAPTFSSQGFCALEIGVVEKDPTMTLVGIKAYYKRKHAFSSKGLKKNDKSKGVFEGLLGYRIHERIVETQFPKMKSMILGCDLRYDEATAHYLIAGAEPSELAYEEGLRNGDILLKIDGEVVTPGNLFGFFLKIDGESLKNVTVLRKKEEIHFPVSVFYLHSDSPHIGIRVTRDPKTKDFKITNVRDGSPAGEQGLLPGDVLLRQNDFVLDNWKNYYRAILAERENQPQVFQIRRDDSILKKTIIPRRETVLL